MTRPLQAKPFRLPAETTILFRHERGKIVAHNLDFDLVSVDQDIEIAAKKIRACTKSFVEYGLEHGLEDAIARPASQEYWDMLEDAAPLEAGAAIQIHVKTHSPKSRTSVMSNRIQVLPHEVRIISVRP